MQQALHKSNGYPSHVYLQGELCNIGGKARLRLIGRGIAGTIPPQDPLKIAYDLFWCKNKENTPSRVED